jgi:hypothetical protein
MKDVVVCQRGRRKKELHKTEEQIEKNQTKGQEDLESICDEIIRFKKTGCYDLM